MKSFDLTSILGFFVGLGILLGICFGGAYFAAWLRREFLVASPAGRFLCKLGLHAAKGTIDDLQKGKLYVVAQDFFDFHETCFRTGEILTFVKYEYFPYHGGYVLEFKECAIYLQEIENAEILQKIWACLEPLRK